MLSINYFVKELRATLHCVYESLQVRNVGNFAAGLKTNLVEKSIPIIRLSLPNQVSYFIQWNDLKFA